MWNFFHMFECCRKIPGIWLQLGCKLLWKGTLLQKRRRCISWASWEGLPPSPCGRRMGRSWRSLNGKKRCRSPWMFSKVSARLHWLPRRLLRTSWAICRSLPQDIFFCFVLFLHIYKSVRKWRDLFWGKGLSLAGHAAPLAPRALPSTAWNQSSGLALPGIPGASVATSSPPLLALADQPAAAMSPGSPGAVTPTSSPPLLALPDAQPSPSVAGPVLPPPLDAANSKALLAPPPNDKARGPAEALKVQMAPQPLLEEVEQTGSQPSLVDKADELRKLVAKPEAVAKAAKPKQKAAAKKPAKQPAVVQAAKPKKKQEPKAKAKAKAGLAKPKKKVVEEKPESSKADVWEEDKRIRRKEGVPLQLLLDRAEGCSTCRKRPFCTRSCWVKRGFNVSRWKCPGWFLFILRRWICWNTDRSLLAKRCWYFAHAMLNLLEYTYRSLISESRKMVCDLERRLPLLCMKLRCTFSGRSRFCRRFYR